MSIITWPATLRVPAEFTISQARFDIVESSDATGAQADRLFGPPRWRVALRSVEGFTLAEAGVWEAMLLQLRGGINRLALFDPVRTAPQGTMRGTMTLNGLHNAGVTAISVTAGAGQAGQTLLPGDWLQIGSGLGTSQLVKVMSAAAANGSGVIALNIEPPLRIGFSTGAAVTWDRPVCHYRQLGVPQWGYRAGLRIKSGGFALDLLEAWS